MQFERWTHTQTSSNAPENSEAKGRELSCPTIRGRYDKEDRTCFIHCSLGQWRKFSEAIGARIDGMESLHH